MASETIGSYTILSRKGAGTFSDVLTAKDSHTGEVVAIKKMKNKYKSYDQVMKFREIQALRRLAKHPNIVELKDVLYSSSTGELSLVFEMMEMNLYEYLRDQKSLLNDMEARSIIYQVISGLQFAHSKGIFHRDIKPENILLNRPIQKPGNKDKRNLYPAVKLADFGSCRGMNSSPPYTEYISTRWYRSPECILSDGNYGPKMDVFAIGCVVFEIITLTPLFPGKNEQDQMTKIHNILGTPNKILLEKIRRGVKNNPIKVDWEERKGCGLGYVMRSVNINRREIGCVTPDDPTLIDLLSKMLKYDPDERCNLDEVLKHPYFDLVRILYNKQRVPVGGMGQNQQQQKSQQQIQGFKISGMASPGGLSGSNNNKPLNLTQTKSPTNSVASKYSNSSHTIVSAINPDIDTFYNHQFQGSVNSNNYKMNGMDDSQTNLQGKPINNNIFNGAENVLNPNEERENLKKSSSKSKSRHEVRADSSCARRRSHGSHRDNNNKGSKYVVHATDPQKNALKHDVEKTGPEINVITGFSPKEEQLQYQLIHDNDNGTNVNNYSIKGTSNEIYKPSAVTGYGTIITNSTNKNKSILQSQQPIQQQFQGSYQVNGSYSPNLGGQRFFNSRNSNPMQVGSIKGATNYGFDRTETFGVTGSMAVVATKPILKVQHKQPQEKKSANKPFRLPNIGLESSDTDNYVLGNHDRVAKNHLN